MERLIDSMRKYFAEKNMGFYHGWDVGYCKNCSAIVFITGTGYTECAGYDCLGAHYQDVKAGAQHCSECQSTKYVPLEDFLIDEQLAIPEVLKLFDGALEKFRDDHFTWETSFSLYDKDGVFRQEITKWLGLTEEEKVSVLAEQRELKRKIGDLKELTSKYVF